MIDSALVVFERSTMKKILLLIVAIASIPGCLAAPQEQTLRSAEGGDRIGSTPSVVIHTAGNATLNVFSAVDSHDGPTTQPSGTGATTITQTVSGASSAASSPGTSGNKSNQGTLSGGAQASSPTNDVKPSTSIPINITPGAGGLLNK